MTGFKANKNKHGKISFRLLCYFKKIFFLVLLATLILNFLQNLWCRNNFCLCLLSLKKGTAFKITHSVVLDKSVLVNTHYEWEPFIRRGMNGMMGGVSLETDNRYTRWFLEGSISVSKSANIFLNFPGSFCKWQR